MKHERSENFLNFGWEAASAASPRRRLSLRTLCYMMATLLCVSGLAGTGASAQSVNQAALVVVHGDGRVVTRCVDFSEAQITGADLLQRSGLDLNIEASSMGATICRIDGEGCTFPQQSCFCQCEGASCVYWSYWRWENGGWRYSQMGASNSTVAPGSLDGWVWGAGTVDSAQAPPVLTFASICAAPTATATFTPTPTATSQLFVESAATATSTNTPTLIPTPLPTLTATPALPAAAPAPLTAPPTATPSPTPLPTETPAPPIAANVMASPVPAPVIEFFNADHREIHVGETVVLTWRTHYADVVQMQASGRTVSVEAEGALRLAPPQNTTYQLNASGPGGVASTALTVIVRPVSQGDGDLTAAGQAPIAPTITLAQPPTEPLMTLALAPTSQAPTPTSPDNPTPGAAPLISSALAPPADQTPTLAPVALGQPQPQAPASPLPASAVPQATEVAISPLVMVVGLIALAGLPLLGIAGLLLLWVLRRVE